jgi:hypothetical protein
MHNVKQIRSARSDEVPDGGASGFEDEREDTEALDFIAAIRVTCPSCEQPVGVVQPAAVLPRHAVCATPWDPFGLTVCPGSGQPVSAAEGPARVLEAVPAQGGEAKALPEGLDWRLQPFSHVGGPAARPMRVPAMRRTAAAGTPRAA